MLNGTGFPFGVMTKIWRRMSERLPNTVSIINAAKSYI